MVNNIWNILGDVHDLNHGPNSPNGPPAPIG